MKEDVMHKYLHVKLKLFDTEMCVKSLKESDFDLSYEHIYFGFLAIQCDFRNS